MKVLTVVGARPQFVKAAVVSRALRHAGGVDEVLVHTGQHYDDNMSAVFFQELQIPEPAHHLGVGGGPHGEQTGRMLERLERVIVAERPDRVLVYGDTNSTLAGALAASKLHVPVAHVEAGLRSFNRRMPEELNRIVADHLADLLFAPTQAAVRNLATEGKHPPAVELVGDVMYDAALRYGAERGPELLDRLQVEAGGYVLATVHRAENTDDPSRLAACVEGLARAAAGRPVLLPLHPRTRGALERQGLLARAREALVLLEPVGYLDMLALERHAALVATDSGGVQKEAFFFRVPCVTLRGETEWVELVEMGWNRLADPVSAQAVAAAVEGALAGGGAAEPPPELYGGGRASERVAAALLGAHARREAA